MWKCSSICGCNNLKVGDRVHVDISHLGRSSYVISSISEIVEKDEWNWYVRCKNHITIYIHVSPRILDIVSHHPAHINESNCSTCIFKVEK